MKHWSQLAVLPVLLMLCGCRTNHAALRQHEPIHTKGPYVHEPSGMIFPETVAAFGRYRIFHYDTAGHNVSAGYNLARLGSAIAATVYVYPAPVDAKVLPLPSISGPREDIVLLFFDRLKDEIKEAHSDAELVAEREATVTQRDVVKSGHHALFRYDRPTPYGKQKFLSEAYLFLHGKWFIKYRITYLEAYRERCVKDVKQFIEELKWPRGS